MSATAKQDDYSTLKPPARTPHPERLDPLLDDAPSPLGRTAPLGPHGNDPHEIGSYRILRLLGQGGMGKVYLAEDKRLLRVVALKLMLPDVAKDAAARDRFLREARTLAAVRNDHVVTIFEIDPNNDLPFLAMEYLEGQSLEEWISANETPRLGDILRIGREIALGLSAAHARNLIHRDIKPANIWLQAPAGRVKILDFGLARPVHFDSGLTRFGEILGTPYYMSPEQAHGDDVDPRSDLFSLGVVLYRLCSGQFPFQGRTVSAVLTAVATHDPPPVTAFNPAIPETLSELVSKLLQKKPERRVQSAVEVREALAAIEHDLPQAVDEIRMREQPRDKSREAAETPTLGPGGTHQTLAEPRKPASTRRRLAPLWRKIGIAAALSFLAIFTTSQLWPDKSDISRVPPSHSGAVEPIRIGLIYSRSGMLAFTEHPIHDGVHLAVSEINDADGLLGRPIQVVVEDTQSDDALVARKMEKLIVQDKVDCIIGCSTSSSRKAAKPVVERHNHLMLFPRSYEGLESSPNIVYGGQVPNQQILPALKWSVGFLNKKRWYLIGSDSFFAHANAEIIRDEAKALGVEVVGEKYCACGATDMTSHVQAILQAKPDLVINSLVGDPNVAFFRALHREGNRAEQTAVLSFVISEQEMTGLTPSELEGHYCAGHYFHTIDSPRNRAFLKLVASKFDPQLIVSSSMQTSYMLVHLWAQAVRDAGTAEVGAVRARLPGQQYDAPQGLITIDPENLHVEHFSRVAQCDSTGKFVEVYISPRPVRPQPFLTSRPRTAWDRFIRDLHERWGGNWHK